MEKMNNLNVNPMSELEVAKAALNQGIVKFWYTKKDGSRREAIGTRNPSVLDLVGGTPKGEREDRKEQNPLIFCYYDFGKAAWRCFRTDLFGGLLFEQMTREQAAAEVLQSGRAEGDDDIAKSVATRLVGAEMTSAMFRDLLNDLPIGEVVERATTKPSHRAEPSHSTEPTRSTESRATEPTRSTEPSRAELLDELLRLRERETEILRVLLR